MADKSNYRPISILPTLSKLTESIIHSHLMDFILDNNIISPRQAAYLKGDSTTNQLVYLIHKINLAWTQHKIPHLVFLDQSAAFDRVWHKGLISRLEQVNITGKALDLLTSYLANRKQKTVIDGAESKVLDLEAGVPQGSKLGPLLYLIYTETISTNLKCEYLQYADDTILIAIDDDPSQTSCKLNADLKTIIQWAKTWKIKFNPTKTTDMIFTKKTLNNSPPVKFDNTNVMRVSKQKHLGLHLTNDLAWDWHITEISKKVNQKLHILRNVKMLCRRSLVTMYKTYIRSFFDYASQAFSSSLTRYQLEKLEKLQYNAARVVTGAYPSTSRAKLLAELGWETLENRFKMLNIVSFQKVHNGTTRPLIRNCLPEVSSITVETRNKNYYKAYNIKSEKFLKTFFPSTIKIWNKLPTKYYDINELKQYLKYNLFPPKARYNNIGSKLGNMFHTQLRVSRSNLSSSRFQIGLEGTPECDCGAKNESLKHFILQCNKYNLIRVELLNNIKTIIGNGFDRFSQPKIIDTLLFGLPDNPDNPTDRHLWQINKKIASSFQSYLLRTKRLGLQKNNNLPN